MSSSAEKSSSMVTPNITKRARQVKAILNKNVFNWVYTSTMQKKTFFNMTFLIFCEEKEIKSHEYRTSSIL